MSSSSEPLATGKRKKSSSRTEPQNKGLDPSWPFAVPAGYILSEPDSDGEVDEKFDWDTLKNNPNLELWLIRVPHNLPLKHLESVPFSSSTSRRPEKIGELNRKQTTYDIWSCDAPQSDDVGRADGEVSIAEEMNSVTCLLPRKSKKNTLYAAPKPITRHIAIMAQPAQVQHTSDADGKPATVLQNPPRQSYPPELLKHRFMPCGSLAPPAKEEKETQGQDHRHKTKSKKDTTNVLQTNQEPEIVSSIDMDVDITPQDSQKKDKKGGSGKRGTTASEPPQDSTLSPSTAEENGTAKKRKGIEEASQDAVEGKRRKKPKTKTG